MPRDDVKEMPFIPFSISRFIICCMNKLLQDRLNQCG